MIKSSGMNNESASPPSLQAQSPRLGCFTLKTTGFVRLHVEGTLPLPPPNAPERALGGGDIRYPGSPPNNPQPCKGWIGPPKHLRFNPFRVAMVAPITHGRPSRSRAKHGLDEAIPLGLNRRLFQHSEDRIDLSSTENSEEPFFGGGGIGFLTIFLEGDPGSSGRH